MLSEFLKIAVARLCSRSMQERIRKFYVTRQVLAESQVPEREIEIVKRLLKAGDHAADIGANVGTYTLAISGLVGAKGLVYAFEPIPNNFGILSSVCNHAQLSNVQLFEAAVGSTETRSNMVIPSIGSFEGYYQAHLIESNHDAEKGAQISVNILTLDRLFKEKVISRLDFVKCDVEGGEIDVLLGGSTLFREALPAFLIEVSRSTSARCFQLMAELGYKAFVYGNKLQHTETYLDKQFSNYFFLHPSSPIWNRLSEDLAGTGVER